MIKVQNIDSMTGFLNPIQDQPYREEMGRHRSLYAYRGVPNIDFHLMTSFQRNCKSMSKSLEINMLRNFKKYAISEEPEVAKSIWMELIIGQHHGLPTRLLDWTHSPLIAAHFATSEYDMDQMESHDCVIWRIDMKEMDSLLPLKYLQECRKLGMDVFSFDMLSDIGCDSLEQYDEDMKDSAMVIIEPPSIDPRIVNQYSFFSIVPNQVTDIEGFLDKNTNNTVKYVISKNIRWEIRDFLDEANISERMVYPGLDGISKWLGRHYFVRTDI